mgnify:CR=1 FL=1
MTVNRCGGCHGRADQVGATTVALSTFEVAVAGGGTTLARLQPVGIHGQAHGTTRLTPLKASSLKNFIDNPAAPSAKVAISQYPKKSAEGAVMGYSIRNDRYRATFYRLRNSSQIVGTELYDEQHDPDETVSLASQLEHKELLENLAKNLPPVGSDADTEGGKSKKGKSKGKGRPAMPAAAASSEDRAARFDKLDQDKVGKLSREFYTTHQSDAVAAGERFRKWDANKDGFLSRDEYLKQGK